MSSMEVNGINGQGSSSNIEKIQQALQANSTNKTQQVSENTAQKTSEPQKQEQGLQKPQDSVYEKTQNVCKFDELLNQLPEKDKQELDQGINNFSNYSPDKQKDILDMLQKEVENKQNNKTEQFEKSEAKYAPVGDSPFAKEDSKVGTQGSADDIRAAQEYANEANASGLNSTKINPAQDNKESSNVSSVNSNQPAAGTKQAAQYTDNGDGTSKDLKTGVVDTTDTKNAQVSKPAREVNTDDKGPTKIEKPQISDGGKTPNANEIKENPEAKEGDKVEDLKTKNQERIDNGNKKIEKTEKDFQEKSGKIKNNNAEIEKAKSARKEEINSNKDPKIIEAQNKRDNEINEEHQDKKQEISEKYESDKSDCNQEFDGKIQELEANPPTTTDSYGNTSVDQAALQSQKQQIESERASKLKEIEETKKQSDAENDRIKEQKSQAVENCTDEEVKSVKDKLLQGCEGEPPADEKLKSQVAPKLEENKQLQTEIDALKEQKTQAENEVKQFENYGQELNKKSPNDIISSEDIEKFNQVGQPAEMSGMEKLQFALGITNMALNTAVPITNLAMGNYGGNRGYMPQMQQMNPYMQGAMANPGMMGNNPYMQGAMGAMGIANAGLNLAGGIVDLASSGSRPPQMSMPQMQFGQQMDPIQMQAMINASGQDVAMQNARYMTQMITGNLNKEMANLTNQAGSIYDQKA